MIFKRLHYAIVGLEWSAFIKENTTWTILQYPPCYKDMSFWINDSFTENNLCEVVRGVAGDLVEEVSLQFIPALTSSLIKLISSFVYQNHGSLYIIWYPSKGYLFISIILSGALNWWLHQQKRKDQPLL